MNFNESCGCKCRLYSFTVYIHTYESYTRIHTRFFERLEGPYTPACSYVCKISSPLPSPPPPLVGPRGKRRQMSEFSWFFFYGAFTVSRSKPTQRCLLRFKSRSQKEIISDRPLSTDFPRVVGARRLRIVPFPFSVVAVSNLVIFLAGISEWDVAHGRYTS